VIEVLIKTFPTKTEQDGCIDELHQIFKELIAPLLKLFQKNKAEGKTS
jgi:hypothetical protein